MAVANLFGGIDLFDVDLHLFQISLGRHQNGLRFNRIDGLDDGLMILIAGGVDTTRDYTCETSIANPFR
jgi:hypothetical protein